jgi:hypothetical protein
MVDKANLRYTIFENGTVEACDPSFIWHRFKIFSAVLQSPCFYPLMEQHVDYPEIKLYIIYNAMCIFHL